MSENSSDKAGSAKKKVDWRRVALLPLWVAFGFSVAQLVFTTLITVLNNAGIPFATYNLAVLNAVFAACVYTLTLVIVLGVPFWLRKKSTTRFDLGLWRMPSWSDIGLAPIGFLLYLIVTAVLAYVAVLLIPGYDQSQVQETGFANLRDNYEYILAFATLIVIAPVAEEVLFRGYLYGKLRKSLPAWGAVLIVSLLFGAVHGQWNVGVDVFALSLVLCTLREVTGSIWAGILLHMIKNSIAFYLLFINPSLLNIMGG